MHTFVRQCLLVSTCRFIHRNKNISAAPRIDRETIRRTQFPKCNNFATRTGFGEVSSRNFIRCVSRREQCVFWTVKVCREMSAVLRGTTMVNYTAGRLEASHRILKCEEAAILFRAGSKLGRMDRVRKHGPPRPFIRTRKDIFHSWWVRNRQSKTGTSLRLCTR